MIKIAKSHKAVRTPSRLYLCSSLLARILQGEALRHRNGGEEFGNIRRPSKTKQHSKGDSEDDR
jgi:hypothetical protein